MSKASTQAGRPKTRNWQEYNRGLVARGDLTVWISPEVVWHASEGTGRRGRPPVFTDAASQCVLTLKVPYQLPLRATQAMAGSLIRLAGLDWTVPHYSTLPRRQKNLTVSIPDRPSSGPLHVVSDSTGLKVLGEGEWKVRKHGADTRRVWRKVHLAIPRASAPPGWISRPATPHPGSRRTIHQRGRQNLRRENLRRQNRQRPPGHHPSVPQRASGHKSRPMTGHRTARTHRPIWRQQTCVQATA